MAQALSATAVTLVAAQATTKPFRVLVDASKDGGVWWFPQGPPDFDPAKDHQGKAMADAMRAKGWEVTELPRETVVTLNQLTGFDLVIRPPAFFPYSETEASAYRESVASGTRLLIMDQSTTDRVAAGFRVRFGPRNQMGRAQKWIPHALTSNIGCCDLTWRPMIETPSDAVLLAWLNAQDPGGDPVLAYLPHGQGEVIFAGLTLHFLAPDHPILNDLLNHLAGASTAQKHLRPIGPPVHAKISTGPSPPILLSPPEGATLPQLQDDHWHFDWENVRGARHYQIVVLGASAHIPMFNSTTHDSEVSIPQRQSTIAGHNLNGWTWQVRAQDRDGQWGDWSLSRTFDVLPTNK